MIPNGLTYGGISGITRLVQTTLKIDYNIMFYALSLTVLMAVWGEGKGFSDIEEQEEV